MQEYAIPMALLALLLWSLLLMVIIKTAVRDANKDLLKEVSNLRRLVSHLLEKQDTPKETINELTEY